MVQSDGGTTGVIHTRDSGGRDSYLGLGQWREVVLLPTGKENRTYCANKAEKGIERGKAGGRTDQPRVCQDH